MEMMQDPDGYLARMAAPLRDKVRVARWFPKPVRRVLDVGAADGTVTCAIGEMFPDTELLGIELRKDFCERAISQNKCQNVWFRRQYISDFINGERFDAVLFLSVMHEIYSFGGGITGAARALAGATAILNPGGRIIIRDMIIHDYANHTSYADVAQRVYDTATRYVGRSQRTEGFINRYGSIGDLANLNHFLLKYLYVDNWHSELEENYVALTWEWYVKALEVFGLKIIHRESYLLPYLRNKWQGDFDLTDEEMIPLLSTGVIVAELP